ncbi:MAG: Glu-tRNA(Gln) amidotransferase subunit GatE [Nitrosopumilus sp.]|nr:Glu-tRNA(Gln) amidotransferase subunit GatE [Nitrosopumilus sp.]MDA7943096.1 Glu-tRNA(Gln) amidotransferase subunit GatE [Nitrosopumilus sp.]
MTIEVRVGLEVHQQLDTGSKLFCGCVPAESQDSRKVLRNIRTKQGETGITDSAVIFVENKQKTITYNAGNNICMVELDEEPPHDVDLNSWRTALAVAHALNSKIIPEIYVMRKTVVDGSNTTGFQRTMLISTGGSFKVGKYDIGIQSICLEEDSAKMVNSKNSLKEYDLGRLGIPLIEIATEPFDVDSSDIKSIALELGKILRSTGMAKRGIGSIRQDVNVSVNNGTVIEIKGVQQLDLLDKVVECEIGRQLGMLSISRKIKNWEHSSENEIDVTTLFTNTKSKILYRAIKAKQSIHAVLFKDLKGIFGYAPSNGVRLGKDIAEIAQALGFGGIFHSDELPNYGITDEEVKNLKIMIEANNNDAFFIVAGSKEQLNKFIKFLIERMISIQSLSILSPNFPKDTRLATSDGTTRFLRPKPEITRMYPETDIPRIPVLDEELAIITKTPLRSWDEEFAYIQKKYGLNKQLAEQILDSRYIRLFHNIAGRDPTFVASVLCYTITSLTRSGGDPELLTDDFIVETFEMFFKNKIVKESIEIIFNEIMNDRAHSVDDAIKTLSINSMNTKELEEILHKLVMDNKAIVKKHGIRATKPLMGKAMNMLRGKASGNTINRMLIAEIEKNTSHQNLRDNLQHSNNKKYDKNDTIDGRISKKINPMGNRSFDEF